MLTDYSRQNKKSERIENMAKRIFYNSPVRVKETSLRKIICYYVLEIAYLRAIITNLLRQMEGGKEQ